MITLTIVAFSMRRTCRHIPPHAIGCCNLRSINTATAGNLRAVKITTFNTLTSASASPIQRRKYRKPRHREDDTYEAGGGSSNALALSAGALKREGGGHTREDQAQRKDFSDKQEEEQRSSSSSSSSAHAHQRATLSAGAHQRATLTRHPLVPALKGLPTGGEFAQTSSAPPASAEAPPSLKSGGAAVTSSETRLLLCANSDSLYNGSSAGEFVHTRRRPQGTPEDTPPTLGGAEGEVLQGRMR